MAVGVEDTDGMSATMLISCTFWPWANLVLAQGNLWRGWWCFTAIWFFLRFSLIPLWLCLGVSWIYFSGEWHLGHSVVNWCSWFQARMLINQNTPDISGICAIANCEWFAHWQANKGSGFCRGLGHKLVLWQAWLLHHQDPPRVEKMQIQGCQCWQTTCLRWNSG